MSKTTDTYSPMVRELRLAKEILRGFEENWRIYDVRKVGQQLQRAETVSHKSRPMRANLALQNDGVPLSTAAFLDHLSQKFRRYTRRHMQKIHLRAVRKFYKFTSDAGIFCTG